MDRSMEIDYSSQNNTNMHTHFTGTIDSCMVFSWANIIKNLLRANFCVHKLSQRQKQNLVTAKI